MPLSKEKMYLKQAWVQYTDLLSRLGKVYKAKWSEEMLSDKVKLEIEAELLKPVKFIVQSNGMLPVQLLSDCFNYWALWTLHKFSPSLSERERLILGQDGKLVAFKGREQQQIVRSLADTLNVKFFHDCGALSLFPSSS